MSKTKRIYRCTKRDGNCPRGVRPLRPLTAAEALQLLESAIAYCQQAGMSIAAANGSDGTLQLYISNVHCVLL